MRLSLETAGHVYKAAAGEKVKTFSVLVVYMTKVLYNAKYTAIIKI